jgi:hypothetical protein
MDHLDKHSILSTNQFGFQRNISADDAIYKLLDEVLTTLNKKSKTIGIVCDINKAFDCVNHDILIKKFEVYGITGISKNYLVST